MVEHVSHSPCGLSECNWIDCAEHQWNGGRACESQWFAMLLGNLRARLFVRYAAHVGVPREDAADISQNIFFAQAFDGDAAGDARIALEWARITMVSAPGGSA